MYSLLKSNNSLVIKTKYIVDGETFCRTFQKFYSQCSPASTSIPAGLVVSHYCENARQLNKKTYQSFINGNSNYVVRHFQNSAVNLYAIEPGKASSKVEETVTVLKEKALERKKAKKPRRSIKQAIIDECIHYYHGFRLLFIDINVSTKLVWKVLKGYSLTRREHKLLVRTVGDLFRLVPFSVFIIVPFLEFTLPFFIKFFPGMLPSTFETATEKEDKLKRSLKVKLEMAKFLQRTLDDMAVTGKGHSSEAAKEFAQFFEKVRTSGHMTTSDEIMKFSKLFEDEITLDSLPRPQLMALCRVLEMNPIGTTNFLRFQLRLKLRSLAADDMMIHLEGVDSLSQSELQAACRARGMRALGVSEERLKAQLNQWLDLSLVKKVPPSLLLLSQAFMLPETTPTEEKLAATIQALPDAVGTATKAVIGEREGKVDYKTKIEIIKEEVAMIKEERMEEREEQAKLKELQAKEAQKRAEEEALVDTAPTLMDKAKTLDPAFRAAVEEMKHTAAPEKLATDEVTTKDIEALESALDNLGKCQKKLIVEKEELQELREEMKEYQEDVADLQKLMMEVGKEMNVKETKAAQRLFKKVNNMISKIDTVLHEVEKKEAGIVEDKKLEDESGAKAPISGEKTAEPAAASKTGDEKLRIDDLISTIRKLHSKEDTSRLERIKEILSKMDADRDGSVRVDVVLKMLDLVGHENVKLSKKQVDELISLIDKEEVLVQECERKKEDEKKAAAAAEGACVVESVPTNKTELHEKYSSSPTERGSAKLGDCPKQGGVAPVVTTSSNKTTIESAKKQKTIDGQSNLDETEKKQRMDAISTITVASVKSPPKSSNSHQSIAEPTPGSRSPKNLR
ncbi:leucine zipper and EF-hand containing transmembrane protein 1 isoform X2 [Rhodnius prolixus]|uniref:leucine zipper and EF-hand containing transmembrane protein 1 isoform X2 n=1 Tax=Rhodnius prolixus TaxID=13249 RepID=UPI003D18EF0C